MGLGRNLVQGNSQESTRMFNILIHQGNENQNDFVIILCHVRMSMMKITSGSSSLEGYKAKGTLLHCTWEYKLR